MKSLDQHMKAVVRGAGVALVLKVAGSAVAFGLNVYIARALGADGAGVFFLALTVATIASVFGRVGLDNALLRFVAAGAGVQKWGVVRGIYRKGMGAAWVASGTAAVLLYATSGVLAEHVFSKPQLREPLQWMALSVVPFALLTLHAEALKGLNLFAVSLFIQGAAVSALTLFFLFSAGEGLGPLAATRSYVGATIIVATIGAVAWRIAMRSKQTATESFPLRELLHSAGPLFAGGLLNLVMNWASNITLGMQASAADVAIFSAASRTAGLVSLLLVAVNSVVAPTFASLYAQGKLAALASTARDTTKLLILLALPVVLAYLVFPREILGLFGPAFRAGGPALVLLAVGQFVNAATGSVGYLLMMTGHERTMRNCAAAAAALNLLLNFTLTKPWGVMGAATATAASLGIINLLAAAAVWRKLGIMTLPIPGFHERTSGAAHAARGAR